MGALRASSSSSSKSQRVREGWARFCGGGVRLALAPGQNYVYEKAQGRAMCTRAEL